MQWAVGSWQWAVGSMQFTVSSGSIQLSNDNLIMNCHQPTTSNEQRNSKNVLRPSSIEQPITNNEIPPQGRNDICTLNSISACHSNYY